MNEEKPRIRDSEIDHILEQVQKSQKFSGAVQANPSGTEAQLDAILSELGVGTAKKPEAVEPILLPVPGASRRAAKPTAVQWAPPPVAQKKAQPQAEAPAPEKAPEPETEAPVQQAAVQEPEQQPEEKEEPPTRELPDLKDYSREEAKKQAEEHEKIREEARREAQKEHLAARPEPVGEAVVQAAREAARKREEEKQMLREQKRAQQMKEQQEKAEETVTGNNLFGEVDDRFRDFFSSTVIDDPTADDGGHRKKGKEGFWARIFSKREEAQEEEPEFDDSGSSEYFESVLEEGFTGEFDAIRSEMYERGEELPEEQPAPEQTKQEEKKSHTAVFLARSITKADTLDFETGSRKRKANTVDFDIPLDGDGTGELPALRRRKEEGPAQESDVAGMDEYSRLSDAPIVAEQLDAMRQGRMMRTVITGILALLMLYMGFSARDGWLPPAAALDPHTAPFTYLIVSLVVLLLTVVGSLPTLWAGLRNLAGTPNADSFTALAVCSALLQNTVWLFAADTFDPEKVTLFAPAAALILCGNALGKWIQTRAVCENFARASSGEEHAAAFLLEQDGLARRLCDGLEQREPKLLLNRPTALVKGFLRQSFSAHTPEKATRIAGLVMVIAAIAAAVISAVHGGILSAFSGLAGVLCLAAPLAATLVYAMPAFLMQRAASACGAVVPGESAAQTLGSVNTVLLSARELFPFGSVRLHGIKTFERERIDIAIAYAASILSPRCETLRSVFMGMLDNNEKLLLPVENPATEVGYGFSGWIEHRRVLMGNREMMKKHDVEVPSMDYEKKYTKDGSRSPIYLAVAGKLFGMFIVSYQPEERAAGMLAHLAQNNIRVLVQGDDFNLSAPLVASVYGLPENMVKVLPQSEQEALEEELAYRPESEGVMIHNGSCESFLGGMRAAARARSCEHTAGILQAAAVLLGSAVGALLSISNGLEGFALGAMLIYQILWTVIITAAVMIKKP